STRRPRPRARRMERGDCRGSLAGAAMRSPGGSVPSTGFFPRAARESTLVWCGSPMRTLGRALGTLAVLVLLAGQAHANECSNPLINTCINSDTYWPNPGPTHFARVSSTETVGRGDVAFSLIATYISRPILLHVAAPGPSGTDAFVIDNQVNGNFL